MRVGFSVFEIYSIFCFIKYLFFSVSGWASLDEDWKKKREETGFAPPDRPKKWRKECRDTIRSIAETK